ncbi:MAG: DUF4388 domain-containing protein, partial [Leptolyngbya sp.]|nr:DUF4388 domain-containing protein [Candidatus Melainabacteria bacterium]
MLPDQNPQQTDKTIRLQKQPHPPTETQIDELLASAKANVGSTVELPFAEAGEPYVLSSYSESAKGNCFWMFYRGVGPNSALLWSMNTDDPGLIHHLMTSQFPALETGFTNYSNSPKVQAVARAAANYRDANEPVMPPDSEFDFDFESDNSPKQEVGSSFERNVKPQHDLLTPAQEPRRETKGKKSPGAKPSDSMPSFLSPGPVQTTPQATDIEVPVFQAQQSQTLQQQAKAAQKKLDAEAAANEPTRKSDSTLKLKVTKTGDKTGDKTGSQGRGWLKDGQGSGLVVEPVADPDSPFVQPAKKNKEVVEKVKRPMLEGDLTNLQMPTLLQSISMGKMTGKLELESLGDHAKIYFKDGVPLHCQLRNSEGETALVEAIGFDQGDFKFFGEPPHHRVTIKKRLDLLLMEGAALIDQSKFLREIGVTLNSYLIRNHADLTEQLFEQMVARGATAELNLQKMFYQLIDNDHTLEDILRRHPMPKPRWVPVIFNLVTCSLVSFSDRPLEEGVEEAATENIDWMAIRAFEESIKEPHTEFLSYAAFFYTLQREYERFDRFQRPFSMIIFDIAIKEELSET